VTDERLRRAVAHAGKSDGDVAALERAISEAIDREGVGHVSREIAAGLNQTFRASDRVSLVVTGLGWLGGGIGAIEGQLVETIETAERELAVVAYSITSGPARVWSALEAAIESGIRCTLVVDRLEAQDQDMYAWLRLLRNRHARTFTVVDFVGEDASDHLHAKIVVADRHRALVGSANLTSHGLLLAHELAVLIDGPLAEEIAGRIDLLTRSALVRRPE
jgi:cardiolipin synthase